MIKQVIIRLAIFLILFGTMTWLWAHPTLHSDPVALRPPSCEIVKVTYWHPWYKPGEPVLVDRKVVQCPGPDGKVRN